MKDICFDENTIQSFLDGEMAERQKEKVACHLAVCEQCSQLLAQLEEETAMIFSALDEEFGSLVPTERIRTNLYRAISEIEKPQKSLLHRIFEAKFIFLNPFAASFAAVFIIFGLIYTLALLPQNSESASSPQIAGAAKNNTPPLVEQIKSDAAKPANSDPAEIINVPLKAKFDARNQKTKTGRLPETKVLRVDYVRSKQGKSAFVSDGEPAKKSANITEPTVAGEQTYLATIAVLKQTVDSSKEEVLRPAARFAFEKDLATINDAIVKMKSEVRRSPKNEIAREMLRNSYQSKIDLLNAVAEKSDLVAALR